MKNPFRKLRNHIPATSVLVASAVAIVALVYYYEKKVKSLDSYYRNERGVHEDESVAFLEITPGHVRDVLDKGAVLRWWSNADGEHITTEPHVIIDDNVF